MKDIDELSTEFQEHMVLVQKSYRHDSVKLAKEILLLLNGCTTMETRIILKVTREAIFRFSKVKTL